MVTEVKHYVKAVQEKFPYFTESEINKIISYGLKRYGWVNRMHCDVLLCNRMDEPINIFCGQLGYDTYKHFKRWIIKYRMRERVMWRLKKKQWDGYYYIGLDDKDHALVKHMGKHKIFHSVYLTKVKNELRHLKIVKHIWRVPWSTDCGWRFFVEKLKTDKAEYVGPTNFSDFHDCFQGKFKQNGDSQ